MLMCVQLCFCGCKPKTEPLQLDQTKTMEVHVGMKLDDGIDLLKNYPNTKNIMEDKGDRASLIKGKDWSRYAVSFKDSNDALIIYVSRDNPQSDYYIDRLFKYYNWEYDSKKPKGLRERKCEAITTFPLK